MRSQILISQVIYSTVDEHKISILHLTEHCLMIARICEANITVGLRAEAVESPGPDSPLFPLCNF